MDYELCCLFLFKLSYKTMAHPTPSIELGLNGKYCCDFMTEILIIKLSFDAMRDAAGEA